VAADTTWVATFDGQVARVYRLNEDAQLIHVQEEGLDARPHADEEPDGLRLPRAEEALGMSSRDAFIRRLTAQLDARARAGAFERLIVSASPGALALFREHASGALKARVAVELNKDHVHTPVKQLEAALASHFREADPAATN